MKTKEFTGTLLETKELAKNIYILSFQINTNFDFIPGQFLMIDVGKNLRRPFAIFDFKPKTKTLSILVKQIGSGTIKLINTAISTSLNILAPLGNGYNLDTENPILLAGGIGLASIYPLIKHFEKQNRPFTTVLGYKTKNEIPNLKEIKDAIIYTEDGTYGEKGFPTNYLKELTQNTPDNKQVVYTCGPHALIEALQAYAKYYNIFASLEEKMACGVGACLSCVVKTKDGLQRVCKDGPVFNLENINF